MSTRIRGSYDQLSVSFDLIPDGTDGSQFVFIDNTKVGIIRPCSDKKWVMRTKDNWSAYAEADDRAHAWAQLLDRFLVRCSIRKVESVSDLGRLVPDNTWSTSPR